MSTFERAERAFKTMGAKVGAKHVVEKGVL
jgi:hypothetical protein